MKKHWDYISSKLLHYSINPTGYTTHNYFRIRNGCATETCTYFSIITAVQLSSRHVAIFV